MPQLWVDIFFKFSVLIIQLNKEGRYTDENLEKKSYR